MTSGQNPQLLPASLEFLTPKILEPLVRLGNQGDGGYVIPEAVIPLCQSLISFGVNDDWSFEEDWLKRSPNCVVHAYDPTVSRKVFWKAVLRDARKAAYGKVSLSALRKRINTYKGYRSFFSSAATHYTERVNNRVQYPGDVDLTTVFQRLPAGNAFLKIDIEGSEYRIINDVLSFQDRIPAMVVEFHDCERLRLLLCESVKSLQQSFEIVHLHGNNAGDLCPDGLPEGLEVTLVSRAYFNPGNYRTVLPIEGLDYPNLPDREDYPIKFTRC